MDAQLAVRGFKVLGNNSITRENDSKKQVYTCSQRVYGMGGTREGCVRQAAETRWLTWRLPGLVNARACGSAGNPPYKAATQPSSCKWWSSCTEFISRSERQQKRSLREARRVSSGLKSRSLDQIDTHSICLVLKRRQRLWSSKD